ncbi:hypothetical protein RCL1_006338 [Eukaryota sp. TZLM3-RCL]
MQIVWRSNIFLFLSITDASLRLQNAKSKEADLLSRISRLSSDLDTAKSEGVETAEELAKRESQLQELQSELSSTKTIVATLQINKFLILHFWLQLYHIIC